MNKKTIVINLLLLCTIQMLEDEDNLCCGKKKVINN